jgi:hypothetical protein
MEIKFFTTPSFQKTHSVWAEAWSSAWLGLRQRSNVMRSEGETKASGLAGLEDHDSSIIWAGRLALLVVFARCWPMNDQCLIVCAIFDWRFLEQHTQMPVG